MCADRQTVPHPLGSRAHPSPPVGVWSITLWTAGRAPLLVAFSPSGPTLSSPGKAVLARWRELGSAFAGVVADELMILPDRVRGILHVSAPWPGGAVDPVIAWLKGAAQQAYAGASGRSRALWEAEFEAHVIMGPEELALCRRRLRAAAGALFGAMTSSRRLRGGPLRRVPP